MPVEEGHRIDYAVCDNVATLLYLVNLGAIAQNPWSSRVKNPNHPDWMVFDLDPSADAKPRAVCQAALNLRRVLQNLGLNSYAKTSGSSGLHVYVPIKPDYDFGEVAELARFIALRTAAGDQGMTTERKIKSRPPGTVYLDYLQNARGKSVAAPYCVRAKSGATVSAPLTWSEIKGCPSISDFDIRTMPERLKRHGDLFKPVLTSKQSLQGALKQAVAGF
ncbi:MAG: hypothetical protein L0387_44435 [Acidobacteria bacterium]|nr:hypothetical protein [Acidobacteriota bacterium]MCI0628630.1 hypothetical protein [Acidobacteriota bacterium]MCI0723016.1 hypothetical protein [Acidobacteriota bacterium]